MTDEAKIVKYIQDNYAYDEGSGVVYNKKTKDMGFETNNGTYVYYVHRTPYGVLNYGKMAFAIKEGIMPNRIKFKDKNSLNYKWDNMTIAGAVGLGKYRPGS
jgi:hypothetical protein